jgi:hypothetical protein
MKFKFKTYRDYSSTIEEKLEKLSKKFSKLPETILKYTTSSIKSENFEDFLEYEIEILTPIIKYEGFSHIATLKKEMIEEEGKHEIINMVFPANGYESESFTKYFEESFRCDHCKTNRNRIIVHLFRNEQNEDLMIASKCSKDYFGINVFNQLKIFNDYSVEQIFSDLEDMFSGCGYRSSSFDKTKFCKIAYGFMKTRNAYVSQKKSEESAFDGIGTPSTRASIENLLSPVEKRDFKTEWEWENGVKERKLELDKLDEVAKDFDISKVKDFWENLNASNLDDNFIRSCYINFSLLNCRKGLLVYSIFKYMLDVENCFKTKVIINSNHVGTIGERIKNVEVTIIHISTFENQYGLTFFIKMLDNQGNLLVWFSSKNPNLEKNEKAFLTGTVKKHDVYKDTKQTILSRCKLSVSK